MTRAKIQWPIGSRVLVLGFVLAALLAASLMLTARPAHADRIFTVNSVGDPGSGGCNSSECTLREAIALANRVSGADTIEFNIPDEDKTILPATDLPTITEQLTIDGYSQPGSRPNSRATGGLDTVILVELNGINGDANNGLEIAAPNVVVRGLAITFFRFNGIQALDGAQGARIEGNFIGTATSGTQDRGNGSSGVNIVDGGNHTIGGTTPDKRNLISGNDSEAVNLDGEGGNKVQGNLIGVQKDGSTILGGSDRGVDADTPNNTIGGPEPGAANVIAHNSGPGVATSDDSSTGNRILNNSIFSNQGLGIDLGRDLNEDGRTDNDPKDRDKGANNLQNFPVLSSAESAGEGKIAIKGKLNSTPNKKFTIQLFSNPSGEDEGETFLGQKKVTTNRKGKASFSFEITNRLPVGTRMTATATGPGGNTSEFSDPLLVDLATK